MDIIRRMNASPRRIDFLQAHFLSLFLKKLFSLFLPVSGEIAGTAYNIAKCALALAGAAGGNRRRTMLLEYALRQARVKTGSVDF